MRANFAAALALGTVLACGAVLAGAGQEGAAPGGVPDFHRVNEHLYRGGQPSEAGFRHLAGMGVKTVIDLRGLSFREKPGREKNEVESAGMRYVSIPLSPAGAPDVEKLQAILKVLDSPENWPVFVHCKLGHDRTGVVVACYRIAHDGWTNERALDEAYADGLSVLQIPKRRFIRAYYQDSGLKKPSPAPPVAAAAVTP